MIKKDSAPVQQGQYYAKAIYHTEWDDGNTTIENECGNTCRTGKRRPCLFLFFTKEQE